MDWLSILTTSSTGGLLGLVGSWLTKREERKDRAQLFAHQESMAKISAEEAKAEATHELAMADKQMERAQVEGDLSIAEVEAESFQRSLRAQSKATGVMFVDAIRGLMRPLITVFMLVITSILAYNIHQAVGGLKALENEPAALLELYRYIINQLLFLTATSVTWWFGSRPSSDRKVDNNAA